MTSARRCALVSWDGRLYLYYLLAEGWQRELTAWLAAKYRALCTLAFLVGLLPRPGAEPRSRVTVEPDLLLALRRRALDATVLPVARAAAMALLDIGQPGWRRGSVSASAVAQVARLTVSLAELERAATKTERPERVLQSLARLALADVIGALELIEEGPDYVSLLVEPGRIPLSILRRVRQVVAVTSHQPGAGPDGALIREGSWTLALRNRRWVASRARRRAARGGSGHV